MSAIIRSDLHNNFLKSVIVRLDFQGVLESEMEKVLIRVKPFAKERGFSRYSEKNSNQIDIAVMDKGIPETFETTNRVRRQKVYSFIDENRGIVLDFSNSFICLTINTTHYTPFEDYSDIVSYVADVYKECIDFFTVTRFGIRKINECLMRDITQIQKYFNPALFNYFTGIDGLNTIHSNQLNVFTRNRHHVNLLTNIAQGQSDNETVYSIRLDIDVYLNSVDDILALLESREKQGEINELIFEIYISALTDSFVSLLVADEEFDNSIMIGVERND